MRCGPSWGRWALVTLVLGWLVFIWTWAPAYLTLTVDDSFYYFQIARNVGRGLGPSFDGISSTNGFHPLWQALLVPIASLSGDEMPVRLALSFQLLLVFGGVRFLARRLGRSMQALDGVTAFALLSFYTMKTMVNGTEAALQFCLLCIVTATLASWQKRLSPRLALALGLLCSLVALSRIDAVVFGFAAIAMPIAWPVPGDKGWRKRRLLAAMGFAGFATPVAMMMIVSWLWFGSPLSVSGAIKGDWIRQAATAGSLMVAIGFSVIAVLGFRLVATRLSSETQDLARATFPLMVYASYVVAVHGILPRRLIFEIWYLPPVVALGLLLTTKAVSVAWGERRRSLRILIGFAAIGYALVAGLGWQHRVDSSSYSAYEAAMRSGLWVRSNLPAEAKVAGWDCGIAAWHSHRGIVQLEGLVNSWAFKRDVLDQYHVDEFLSETGVDYLVQPLDEFYFSPGVHHYSGVDLDDWSILRAECVEFTAAVESTSKSLKIYLVLSRHGPGLKFGDVKVAENLCRRDSEGLRNP